MDSFDGSDKNQSLMLMAIRFSSVLLIFSSSMFEVLNPNYSNSLSFHDQETFSTQEYVITQAAIILASGRSDWNISGINLRAQLSANDSVEIMMKSLK